MGVEIVQLTYGLAPYVLGFGFGIAAACIEPQSWTRPVLFLTKVGALILFTVLVIGFMLDGAGGEANERAAGMAGFTFLMAGGISWFGVWWQMYRIPHESSIESKQREENCYAASNALRVGPPKSRHRPSRKFR